MSLEAVLIANRFEDKLNISRKYISEQEFINLKNIYVKKHLKVQIEEFLKVYRFEEAEKFYSQNKEYISEKDFTDFKIPHIKQQRKEEIEEYLNVHKFKEAEILYNQSKEYISEKDFLSLKKHYIIKQKGELLSNLILLQLDKEQLFSIASNLVNNNYSLPELLSLEESIIFISKHLTPDLFSANLEQQIIKVAADSLCDNGLFLKENQIMPVVKRHLTRNEVDMNAESVWTILCHFPKSLAEMAQSSRPPILDKIAFAFPWDKFNIIETFYIPSEEDTFRFIVNNKHKVSNMIFNDIKTILEQYRYYNCLLIFALIQVNNNLEHYETIKEKDICDVLKAIVDKAFQFNSDDKSQVRNLIFPSCISDSGFDSFSISERKKFSISDRNNTFCEGRLREKKDDKNELIVMCRNKKCDERSQNLMKEPDNKNNYFLKFIERYYKISAEQFFMNQEFTWSMGAFNRWNEIVEHLFCGYAEDGGCGSPLTYQKINQVKAGFAAYATTFWHCPNNSCKQHTKSIKLSHCKCCNKIIDSRIDRHHCPREDIMFYICNDCGFCCDKHNVSGICPKCGLNSAWKSTDQYGSWYKCCNCEHTIKVPIKFRGCLLNKNDANKETGLNSNHESTQENEHGHYSIDDIPF